MDVWASTARSIVKKYVSDLTEPESYPFIDSFCQPNFNGSWTSITSELGAFTPCFIDIVVLGSADICLIFFATLRIVLLSTTPPFYKLHPTAKLVQNFLSLLTAFCAVVPLMQLSARVSVDSISPAEPLPPFEICSLVLSSLAWVAATVCLLREFRSTVGHGWWFLRFGIVFVLVGQLAKLRFLLLLSNEFSSFFIILFLAYTGAHVILGLFSLCYYPAPVPGPAYGSMPVQPTEQAGEGAGYQPLPAGPANEVECPEYHTPFLSWVTFSWISPLLTLGRSRPLNDVDVWKLHPSDSAERVHSRFMQCWQEEKQRPNPWLLRALHNCFGPRFWYGGIFKIGNDASQFVGPVMLSSLLTAMQSGEPAWHGYAYATAILLGLVGGVLCEGQYFQNVMRTGVHVRQALVACVFSKSLRLDHLSRQLFSSGRIVNMMTSDTETLQMICQQLHNLWSAPLRIVFCILLLYRQLGVASLAGFALLILMIPLQALIVTSQQKLVKQSLQKADKRIELLNEMMSSMDVVKCYAWEDSFKQNVLKVREEELQKLRVAQYIMAINFFLLNIIPVLVTVVGFGTYALLGGDLTPAKAFTSISLFAVLRMPLYMFPQLISQVIQANVSLKRLQEMLLAGERSLEQNPPLQAGKPAVEVSKSSFSWGRKGEKPSLEDISVSIPQGALVAIVGGTGQGKSSLVSALLGEMPAVDGSHEVTVRGTVAYVAQVAWIYNATVRDNILFGLPFDASKYSQAVRVSALGRDLEQLPGGDLTEIGERGVNVSGGQKQRISIARAVYADADNYFLDDPLSALDAHVARQVFEDCIRDGLRGRTRIMATNQLHLLPHTDLIFVVHGGRIVESGTYEHLMGQGKWLRDLMEQAGSMEETDQGHPAPITQQKEADPPAAAAPAPAVSDQKTVSGNSGKVGSMLVTTEERETGAVSLAVIGRYVAAMGGPFSLIVLLLLYVCIEAARVSSSFWISLWSSSAVRQGTQPTHSASYFISGYAAICILQVLFTFCNQFWLVIASLHAARKLHEGMLSAILRAPMSFFHANPLGRLVNRFTKDTSDIDKNLAQFTSLCLGATFQLLSTFALIGSLNTVALWAMVPLLLLFYFVYVYFQTSAREVKRLDAITRSPVYAQFGEALNGLSTIRSYRAHHRMEALNGQAMDRNVRYSFVTMAANRWLGVRLECLGGLMIWATAIFAVLDVQRADNPSELAATVGLILSYALTITAIMTMVLRLASLAENSFNAVERVGHYSDVQPEAPPIVEGCRPPPGWPSQGSVHFDRVAMRYRADLPPVLKGLSAHVKGGEKVGVVGRTGAGKSSLFNALFRITEIEGGSISVDGVDLSALGLADVRRSLMIIPQTPVLFTGTIRFNLDPFNEHSDVAVWEALSRAHLKDVVAQLPMGLESAVLEGGDNFSVGQRQLLSLARALLRRSRILVLDEATAAVDVGTDALIQKTIREEFKECTMLIIAHRLNTIIDSDRILVMDAGKAVEFDTPAALLANKKSVFSGMVESTGAANAKYLLRIARGELDVSAELAAPAALEKQKWARQSASDRWAMAAKWAFTKSVNKSQASLDRAANGEDSGPHGTVLERVRDATVTLQEVLSGQHDEDLQAALREAGVQEASWWAALRRVIQGLAVLSRDTRSSWGNSNHLEWSDTLALSNAEHQEL